MTFFFVVKKQSRLPFCHYIKRIKGVEEEEEEEKRERRIKRRGSVLVTYSLRSTDFLRFLKFSMNIEDFIFRFVMK